MNSLSVVHLLAARWNILPFGRSFDSDDGPRLTFAKFVFSLHSLLLELELVQLSRTIVCCNISKFAFAFYVEN